MPDLQKKLRHLVIEHSVIVSTMQALKLDEKDYDGINMETKLEGSDLEGGLGADSLDTMEVVMAVEEMHGIDEIPEEEAKKAKTIGDIFNYVVEHCQKDINKIIDCNKPEHCFEKLIEKAKERFNISSDVLKDCNNISELMEKIKINRMKNQ